MPNAWRRHATATENFAWQVKLDKKDTLRLDLLVEETLGMVKAMLEEF